MRSDLRALIGRGLVLLNLAVAVGAATVVVLAWVAPGRLGTWDEAAGTLTLHLADRPGVRSVSWLGLLLIAADVLYLLYGRAPRAPLRHLVSETREGSVMVTREAVENSLRAAGESLAEISRLRVSVRQTGMRRLVVHAWFTAPETTSIATASQTLRRALRQRFETMVQMPDGTRVEYELEFGGFSGRGAKKATEAPAPQEPGVPFTGPQYPIEEDDAADGRG